jgi:hypothetical protein
LEVNASELVDTVLVPFGDELKPERLRGRLSGMCGVFREDLRFFEDSSGVSWRRALRAAMALSMREATVGYGVASANSSSPSFEKPIDGHFYDPQRFRSPRLSLESLHFSSSSF